MAESSRPASLRADRVREVGSRSVGLVALLVAGVVFFSLSSPFFLTSSNIFTLLAVASESGLIAIGMAVVIASGGIDLSVGSTFSLVSVVVGILFGHHVPVVPTVLIGLAVALGCGVFNGLVVVVLRLHPLLVTLGTLALFSGLALGISNGSSLAGFPKSFEAIGQHFIGPVPLQCLFWLVAIVIAGLLTAGTSAGRSLVAVGANDTAAAFSGVRVAVVRICVYGLSGLLSGMAAVIYTSRVLSAVGNAGTGLELLAIAAVVVGGASIQGGEISILRTTLAVIAIAMIPNGFVLAGYDTNLQYVAIGVLMIIAVLLNEGLAGRWARLVARSRGAPSRSSA